jgi:phage repressor protein C with HTH and peptisase S24 domain
MKLLRYFGRPKKPRLLLRRVVGTSMAPALQPGRIVVGGRFVRLKTGDIVVIRHDGIEKIKRVTAINETGIFVEGDNRAYSTDSRHFGWIPMVNVRAKVWWPRR